MFCLSLFVLLQLIWPGLFARHGGRLSYDFDLSTLANLSEGYAAGDLDAVVAGLMTPARRERLKQWPVDIPEILQWLSRVSDDFDMPIKTRRLCAAHTCCVGQLYGQGGITQR